MGSVGKDFTMDVGGRGTSGIVDDYLTFFESLYVDAYLLSSLLQLQRPCLNAVVSIPSQASGTGPLLSFSPLLSYSRRRFPTCLSWRHLSIAKPSGRFSAVITPLGGTSLGLFLLLPPVCFHLPYWSSSFRSLMSSVRSFAPLLLPLIF